VTTSPDIAALAQSSNAEALVVRDQLKAMPVTIANLDQVAEIIAEVKRRYNALEKTLKSITAPMREAEKNARDLFRPAMTALLAAESDLKQRVVQARNAQLAINQQAMAAAQVHLAQGDARAAALVTVVLQDTAMPAGLGARDVWSYEITDEALVPRELCSPDPAKIRAWVAAWKNAAAVPGVRIFEDTIISSRSR